MPNISAGTKKRRRISTNEKSLTAAYMTRGPVADLTRMEVCLCIIQLIRNLRARGHTTIGEDDERMDDSYVYVQDLRQQAKIPENGILSQTLQNDDAMKVILFGFAPGQELSAHTAPFPAMLTFLKGNALLKLGSEERQAAEGTFVYMRPNLEHGIKAQNEVVMLLTMIKSTPPGPA